MWTTPVSDSNEVRDRSSFGLTHPSHDNTRKEAGLCKLELVPPILKLERTLVTLEVPMTLKGTSYKCVEPATTAYSRMTLNLMPMHLQMAYYLSG